MPPPDKSEGGHTPKQISSKGLNPLPENIGPTFFKNQFRTNIALPTKDRYGHVQGQCAIITGANAGLGFEAARQLLSLGLSHLVMGVRSVSRGNAAATQLQSANPSAKIECWHLDMESYDSIQSFARKCQDDLEAIHIVILNAGLAPTTFSIAERTGHETAVQVNHFGTALLTILLMPVIRAKSSGHQPSKLTVVNSLMAHLCKVPNRQLRPFLSSFDDTKLTPWAAEERYGVSKLLNQLFIAELTDRIGPEKVIINMVDPGLTKGTGLSRDVTGAKKILGILFVGLAGRPVAKGAATYVDAVLGHGKESHGSFLMNCEISPLSRWYYSEGKVLKNIVWTETLQSLSFAGVEQIIASME